MLRVLIVDDDVALAEELRDRCADLGHEAVCIHEAKRAISEYETRDPSFVVLDVRLRDGNGLDLLTKLKGRRQELPIAVISGFEPLATASHASAKGADYFLRKPFGIDEFDDIVSRVERRTATTGPVEEQEAPQLGGVTFVGISQIMTQVCHSIGLASRSGATTLIEGESGVGKELAARAVHALSGTERPFIVVDCSAMVETLFESELFGHERGAFTGAYEQQPGKAELADGGVLFLDEIGELSPRMQGKLLRLLQERTVQRVGSSNVKPVDFQVIAATNQNLEQRVRRGQFRADLFYRLNVLRIVLPPVRDRREDVRPLIIHIVKQTADRFGLLEPEVSPKAMEYLTSYDWPGNVRELENVVLRAVLHARSSRLDVADFSEHMGKTAAPRAIRTLEQLERDTILQALRASEWNYGEACRALGISRPTLRRKILRHRLNDFNPAKRED